MKLKIPALAAVDREIGMRGSFYDFVKMSWHVVEHGRPFVDNWHIGAVCEHLEAVYRGQLRNLAINIPPGCMKSLTTSVLCDPWCWIQDPSWRFIYGSFDLKVVDQVPIVPPVNEHNARYLATKRDKLGHRLPATP